MVDHSHMEHLQWQLEHLCSSLGIVSATRGAVGGVVNTPI